MFKNFCVSNTLEGTLYTQYSYSSMIPIFFSGELRIIVLIEDNDTNYYCNFVYATFLYAEIVMVLKF